MGGRYHGVLMLRRFRVSLALSQRMACFPTATVYSMSQEPIFTSFPSPCLVQLTNAEAVPPLFCISSSSAEGSVVSVCWVYSLLISLPETSLFPLSVVVKLIKHPSKCKMDPSFSLSLVYIDEIGLPICQTEEPTGKAQLRACIYPSQLLPLLSYWG